MAGWAILICCWGDTRNTFCWPPTTGEEGSMPVVGLVMLLTTCLASVSFCWPLVVAVVAVVVPGVLFPLCCLALT